MFNLKNLFPAILPVAVSLIFIFDLLYVTYVIDLPITRLPIYLICTAFALYTIAKYPKKIYRTNGISLLLFLFLLAIFNSFISLIEFYNHISGSIFFAKFYPTILIPMYYMLFGLILAKDYKSMYIGFIISLIIITAGTIFLNYINAIEYGYLAPQFYRFEDDYLLDMHYFTDFILALSLIYVGKKKPNSNLFFSIALITSILLGSRTPVVFGVISYLFSKLINSIKDVSRVKKSTLLLILALSLFFVYMTVFNSGSEYSVINRFTSFDKAVLDFDGRTNILAQSIIYANDCLYFGCFPFENIFFDNNGLYVHNLMSFFFSFGSIFFLAFLLVVTVAFRKVTISKSNIDEFLPIYVFLLLCIIFSRSYMWPFWSLILAYIFSKKPNQVSCDAEIFRSLISTQKT